MQQDQVNGSLSSSPEKPLHYQYLKGFRVEQCALFLQHKCTNHKPYTCFDWHFQNQRRRRPVRRRDGTFNYSPDTYCTKYDETTGLCPDKDECPFLHKTAGDTERRYHLRYYKTGMCVYETDARGFCSKNGKHCAFAHGAPDLRNPVFDVRELQTLENGNSSGELSDPTGLLSNSSGTATVDRERNALLEDPRWNETAYVLANYKTELCKRPPRFCRQGYACPQYHNGKDRRRSPKIFKYRSTPCPNTRQGDEWVDPSKCEQGDSCPYCHSRTEQQFHPEIFKSTKCKDIQDTGYCPRGAFCAFAHNEEEIVATRDIDLENIDTASSVQSERDTLNTWLGVSFAEQNNTELPSSLLSSSTTSPNPASKNTLGPIARPRSYSHSQAKSVNADSFNQLHAVLARARLVDELKLQSYNSASGSNPIGFRERAVHSFSIPSATEATQLMLNNSPITALDFLPSSRLIKLNLDPKDIDLGQLVNTSSSPLAANQSRSLSPTSDGFANNLEGSTSQLQKELQHELEQDIQQQQQQQEMQQDQVNGSLSSSPEKPLHYQYLKGFRVEQCALFLQHKCTNHKPYTCFDWHFQNQRRRRPVRRRDGTFNYSPDTYCTKYDETTGLCPDKDECPFLHKTAGDTERRYHLRYYKTGMCVYETDARGFCSKNGKHCAFAHGAPDLRNPVFDVRELQTLENGNSSGELSDPTGLLSNSSGTATVDRERNALLEDPRWNETAYVLANYKTELCKRPPRFCRQGYACPQYHNGKDRRRSPKIFKYRSTPCPNTRQGDEWVDPSKCEQGDSCPYCHSRTEQQFHPEIFKSTKCKDIQDTGYCPRGAFCAFAHNEEEIVATRDIDLENIDTDSTRPMRDMLDTWSNLII